MVRAIYNEIDGYAARWLRNLIQAGHIADGEVEEESIVALRPERLKGFTQAHFFAGIGVWSYALRAAGWPDDRPVFTGSPPCQPFSSAGKRKGFDDERHLWPSWFGLIRQLRPAVIFGEQVSGPGGLGTNPTPRMLELWEQQATLRVLEDRVRGNLSRHLSGMQKCLCEGVEQVEAVIHNLPSRQTDGGGESQSRGAEPAFRFGRGLGERTSRQRMLRGDRHPVRHGGEQGLEHAVSGQGGPEPGLHESKYQAGPVCPECGLRRLGREDFTRGDLRNLTEAQREIGAALERVSGEIQAANGLSWLNALQTDLENEGYAVGAFDTPACGVGAPHIRQRLYWCAVREGELANASVQGPLSGPLGGVHRQEEGGGPRHAEPERPRAAGGLADSGLAAGQRDARGFPGAEKEGGRGRVEDGYLPDGPSVDGHDGGPGPVNGFWRDADWLCCRDGKWRPARPGSHVLAHGVAARMGKVRAFGNCIVGPQATEFVRAVMGAIEEMKCRQQHSWPV